MSGPGIADRLRQAAEEKGLPPLSPEAAGAMEVHYHLLVRWNPAVHLTSVEGEGRILRRHFLESLEAAPALPPQAEPSGTLLDVGTGNGFPAIPLLLLRPGLRGVLLEPAVRKRAFLKEVLRETGLEPRVQVRKDRVDRPADLERLAPFDVLTVRAVAGLATFLAGAAAGLSPGGRALLFVGRQALDQIRTGCPPPLTLVREIELQGRDASFVAVVEKPA